MSAKFTIDGSAAGAVRAVDDLNKILDESKKSADGVTAASKKMVDQAQRIKESIDPQAKYNRQLQDVAKHVQAGTLTMEQARTKAQQYGLALEKAGKEGDKAFGADALRNVGSIATSIVGISSALDLAIGAMRSFREEQQRAADDALRSRMGIGQLSQLAASAPDASGKITKASQDAAMNSLVAETDRYLSMGAAVDRNEAASLTFDLNSAGLSEKDREFAARLRKSGVLMDVASLAQAYDASKTALGEAEVGTFPEFASKAIAAGSVSPGTIQALPLALSRAGADAKKLGMTDEFLLSAGAVLAKEAGSPQEGATKMAALLAGMNKSGVDLQGLSGVEMIERLASENTGYGGIFKDNREAINAFGTIRDNLQTVTGLEASVTAAQSQGLSSMAMDLPNLDPATAAANLRAEKEGEQAVVDSQTLSRGENLRQATMAEWKARKRASGQFGAEWDIFTESTMASLPFISPEFHLQRAMDSTNADPTSMGAIQDPKLLAEVRDYLKMIAENTGTIKQQQRNKIVTGPQE